MVKFLIGVYLGICTGIIIVCALVEYKINDLHEEIWQQTIEIEDLKEQLDKERIKCE